MKTLSACAMSSTCGNLGTTRIISSLKGYYLKFLQEIVSCQHSEPNAYN